MDFEGLEKKNNQREANLRCKLRKKAYVEDLEKQVEQLSRQIQIQQDQFTKMGGFRPSDVIQLILNHVELFNEQLKRMLELKESLMKEESDNTKEMESLQKHISISLSGTDFVDKGDECAMTNFSTEMSTLTEKFTILIDLLEKADKVRQKSLTDMQRILKENQQVSSVFTMNDYFKRFFLH
ncbi:transcription factor TGA2.1-like [Rutidosis leptorrhynchoides]|uniref:transcription factor TGA2.1-like n=1 Tax=Rutidosis leptorrhynchoides TaxID=125765 RepID=UPI003A99EB95